VGFISGPNLVYKYAAISRDKLNKYLKFDGNADFGISLSPHMYIYISFTKCEKV
jgi:hypothetical protein